MENTINTNDFTQSIIESFQKATDQQLVNSFNRECGGRGWTNTRSIYLEELKNEFQRRNWDISVTINKSGGFNLGNVNQVYLEDNKLHSIYPKTIIDFIPVDWQDNEKVNFIHAKKLPRSAKFVTGAEWTWSAMNARFSEYFISSNKTFSHWILWHQIPENGDYGPIQTSIAAWCIRKKDIAVETAAIGLLKATWEWELKNGGYWDENFSIKAGLLSKGVIRTIKYILVEANPN